MEKSPNKLSNKMNKFLVSMLMILSVCAQSSSTLATKQAKHQLTNLFAQNEMGYMPLDQEFTESISNAIADALKGGNKKLLSDLTT